MNNYEEMRIESDVFATARENFDLLMPVSYTHLTLPTNREV